MGARSSRVRIGVLVALAAGAVWTLAELHHLGQTRYFTVDEYQFGHAAWLVSQGQVPYVDFYEHHFPASYVLHAPLVTGDASFAERALRLRQAAFLWMLLAAAGLAWGSWRALRDPCAALLSASLPLATGFGAMSAIEFRADNLAGFAWLLCLALLEGNRGARRAVPAAAAGVLLALAVLATQKLVLLGVSAAAVMLALDVARRGDHREPFVARPLWFLGSGALTGLAALGVAAPLGMLLPGFEATVLHAIEHEELYPNIVPAPYLWPFFRETWPSTALLACFAVAGMVAPSGRLYRWPLLAALVSGIWIRGRFPYNYVVLCVLLGLFAVRGYAALVSRVAARGPRAAELAPLLYLVPLLVIPQQLAFVQGRTSNAHQRHVLAKIERFTQPGDVVIDSAGGALFRDHAAYYWYHGPAHRAFLDDYFLGGAEDGLLGDLRASRAPFWIRDFRFRKLALSVKQYLRGHYVRADGWLYALGIVVEASGEESRERDFEVVRAGVYRVYPAPGGQVAPAGQVPGVLVDGRAVGSAGLALEEGPHELFVPKGSPPLVVSPMPRAVFLDRFGRMRPYSMLFEYERKSPRAWRDRTVLTP